MENKICKKCKEPKKIDCFSKNYNEKDGLDSRCKSCKSVTNKKWWENNTEKMKIYRASIYKLNQSGILKRGKKNRDLKRIYIEKIREESSCVMCGEKETICLDFHHIDPKNKKFKIAMSVRYGWDQIEEELKKCIILCSNCHRKVHNEQNFRS